VDKIIRKRRSNARQKEPAPGGTVEGCDRPVGNTVLSRSVCIDWGPIDAAVQD